MCKPTSTCTQGVSNVPAVELRLAYEVADMKSTRSLMTTPPLLGGATRLWTHSPSSGVTRMLSVYQGPIRTTARVTGLELCPPSSTFCPSVDKLPSRAELPQVAPRRADTDACQELVSLSQHPRRSLQPLPLCRSPLPLTRWRKLFDRQELI